VLVHPRQRLLYPVLGAAFACAAVALLPAAASHATGQATASHNATTVAAHRAVRFGAPLAAQGGAARVTPATIATTAAKTGFNTTGYNWSGYAAQGSGFTSVTSSWTEPSVTCQSTNDLMAPWAGIDGYGSSSVEQTGVATDCSSGRAVYSGWYEMYPANPVYYTNAVSAGDSITATVTRSGTTYTLTLVDSTKGWTKTTTKTGSHANSSAEVIIESPTGSYPKFSTVNFSNSKINGSTLSSYSPVALDASNGVYEDRTSAISGGTNFSITYLHE
jgi:hypothetical protein